ncbi:hypothetical protein Rsub_10540 [Raphidocelis subcapitata]|uniref:Uncharacterized protein n=1 Tax=Raphidocelis subcapitata TaxID=307507 RepID=A0A2V0PE45_9CHLO|nr:hypothetical protein Rsub_10540 [Raphidocelis subcapitata]|eukprot:GBF98128.1 hypothetical protein Rsub_10540 [Raphidocelis subcapitata]
MRGPASRRWDHQAAATTAAAGPAARSTAPPLLRRAAAAAASAAARAAAIRLGSAAPRAAAQRREGTGEAEPDGRGVPSAPSEAAAGAPSSSGSSGGGGTGSSSTGGGSGRSGGALPWGRSSGSGSGSGPKAPTVQRVGPVAAPEQPASGPVNAWQAARQQEARARKAESARLQRQQQEEEERERQRRARARAEAEAAAEAPASASTLPPPLKLLPPRAPRGAGAGDRAGGDARLAAPPQRAKPTSLFGGLLVGGDAAPPAGAPHAGIVRSTRARRTARLRPPVQLPRPPPGLGTGPRRPPPPDTGDAAAAAAAEAAGAAVGASPSAGGPQPAADLSGGAGGLDDAFEMDWLSGGEEGSAAVGGLPALPPMPTDARAGEARAAQQSAPQRQPQRGGGSSTGSSSGSGRGSSSGRAAGGAAQRGGFAGGGGFLGGLADPLPGLQGGLLFGGDAKPAPAETAAAQQREAPPAAAAPLPDWPSVDSRTWPAAAAGLLPRLYDPTWHTSLAAFAADVWHAAREAHDRGDAAALDACHAFARACVLQRGDSGGGGGDGGGGRGGRSSGSKGRGARGGGEASSCSAYAQGCCLLPLAEAASDPDAGALLAGAASALGAPAVRALLLPMAARIGGAAAAAAVEGALRRSGGGGGGLEGDGAPAVAAAAPGLWDGLDVVLALTDVYPGAAPSIAAHLAQQHGAWLD